MKRWEYILGSIIACGACYALGFSNQPETYQKPIVKTVMVNGCTAMMKYNPNHPVKHIKLSELTK